MIWVNCRSLLIEEKQNDTKNDEKGVDELMKIEVETGVHSNKNTKDCKHPLPSNTIIKLDGRRIEGEINYFLLEIHAGEIVHWELGMIGDSRRVTLKRKLNTLFRKVKRKVMR